MSHRLEIYSLGGLVLKTNEVPLITLDSQKAAALLIYLAMTRREHPRERLAEFLFSDRTQQQSLTNLRVVIHRLRQQLDPFLLVSRQTVGINTESACWLDAAVVDNVLTKTEYHLRQGLSLTNGDVATLESAFELYKGDFLAGFSVKESDSFENWAREAQESLRTRLITVIYQLIRHYTDQKAYSIGIATAIRLLQIDPTHEPTHQQLLMLLARSGQRNVALTQHENFKKRLFEELGLDISPETEQLYQQIQTGVLTAETVSPLRIARTPERNIVKSNLPIPATAFVGRSNEVKNAVDLLDKPDCRLLTFVGQGGIGKTRLVIQTAQERMTHFDYGVRYIALASVEAPHLLPITLANALKLSIQGEQDILGQINNYLRDKNILLVFDNFEHLLEGADLLADILAHCSQVKMLVTSRERLHLSGEWLLSVDGLSYPKITALPADIDTHDALKLFAHSAQRTQTRFLLSENMEAVIRICQLVEGMPLAIEIAAGWLWSMSCTQIADQITQDVDFLQTSMRDIPARHRSMRAIFEHSWTMLSELERAALTALTVFQGSFDLAAVQTVTNVSPFTLERLISKSLVRVEGKRYNMHEMTRQYAEEKSLEDSLVYHTLRSRHADYYLNFLATHGHNLSTYETKTAREKIEPEFDNIRSAWLWAAVEQNSALILSVSSIIDFFYWVEGRYHEAIHVFEQAANSLADVPSAAADLHARQARFYIFLSRWQEGEDLLNQSLAECERALAPYILNQLAYSTYMQSRYEEAIPRFEEALAIADELNNPRDKAFALLSLANIAEVRGNYPQARTYYNDSLNYAKLLKNPFLESQIMSGLGQVTTNEGLESQARVYLEQAASLQRTLLHPQLLAQSLVRLGWVALRQAIYDEAESRFREAILIYRDLGQRQGLGNAMNGLASVFYMCKQYDEAKTLFLECLTIYEEIGAFSGKASVLGNLGTIYWSTGDYQESERLFQESLEMYQHIGNQFMIGLQFLNLGNAAMMLSDYITAWYQFQKALEQTMDVGAIGLVLGILVNVSNLLVKMTVHPLAVEILVFVLNHPLVGEQSRHEATLILQEINIRLEEQPSHVGQRSIEEMVDYVVTHGSNLFK